MNSSPDVLAAAMALPESDQADVALHLLESLHGDQESATDQDLLTLADEREAMMDSDPAVEISHEELLAAFSHRRKQ